MYSANVAAGSLSADKAKGLASAANKDGLLELQRWLGGSEASGREVVTIVTQTRRAQNMHTLTKMQRYLQKCCTAECRCSSGRDVKDWDPSEE